MLWAVSHYMGSHTPGQPSTPFIYEAPIPLSIVMALYRDDKHDSDNRSKGLMGWAEPQRLRADYKVKDVVVTLANGFHVTPYL